MAKKKKNEPIITVQFIKPTLDFAVGDIADLPESYVEDVVDPYIESTFSPEEQERYIELKGEVAKTVKPQEITVEELRDEAVSLGIDVSDLGTKKKLEKAIADATA